MDRLTKDSIAAVKAGMTYGKWKALHPHTEEKVAVSDEIEAQEKEVKLCKMCGKPFNIRVKGSGGQNRLYCSRECAYEAIKERERARYHKREDKANGKI